jgi:hypothetical protein
MQLNNADDQPMHLARLTRPLTNKSNKSSFVPTINNASPCPCNVG